MKVLAEFALWLMLALLCFISFHHSMRIVELEKHVDALENDRRY